MGLPVKRNNKQATARNNKQASPPKGQAVGQPHPNSGKGTGVNKYRRPLKDVRGTDRTIQPKAIPDGSKIGPAGEREGGSGKKGKGLDLLKVFKKALGLGKKASPLALITHSEKVGEGSDKVGEGKKLHPSVKKLSKEETSKAKAAQKKAKKKDEPKAKKKAKASSTFGEAFKKARSEGKKTFQWQGKSYSTATKDDVKKSKSKDLREHLNTKEGKKPTSFGSAFAAASKEGKKTFEWNGKKYSTKTK